MSDTVSRRYNQVLEDLGLDGCPMSDYDALDMVSFVVEVEKTFNIQLNDEKVIKII